MKKLTIDFFKNSGKYGLVILLTRVGTLITLPIYWKYMSVEEFGVISVFQAFLIFLSPLLSLSLADSTARFYNEWTPYDREKKISTSWITTVGLGLIFCILLSLFGKNVYLFFFEDVKYRNLWQLIVWTLFFNNFALIPLVVIKAQQKISTFNTLTFLNFAVSTAFSFIGIIIFKQGALGFIYGTFIASMLFGFYYVYFIYTNCGFYFNLKLLKEPLKFCIPLLPSAVVDNFFNSVDRFILSRFFTLSIVGYYDLANRLGSSIGSVNQALKSVWIPLIFAETSANSNSDGPVIYSKLSFLYVTFMLFVGMGFYLFSEFLTLLFGDTQSFRLVLGYLPYLIVIYLLQTIATALGRGIDIAMKTNYSILVPLSGLFLFVGLIISFQTNLTFNLFLVILVGANFFRTMVQIYYSYRFYPRPIYFKKYLSLLLIIGFTLLLSAFFRNENAVLHIVLKTIIFFFYTLGILLVAFDGKLTKLKIR